MAKRPKKEPWERRRPKPTIKLPPAPPPPPEPELLIKTPPLELDKLTDEDIERVLKAIIFFDPRRLFYSDGTLIALDELDDTTALAIAGLEVDNLYGPGGRGEPRLNIGSTKKVKVNDRIRAAELVWKKRGKLGGVDERGDKRNLLAEYLSAVREGAITKKEK